jgi:hypothetical protein
MILSTMKFIMTHKQKINYTLGQALATTLMCRETKHRL